ncbi:MAG: hypothetical protein QF368_13525, partial [SAR202 cluster bacterium]|nr:hypothetical protein [SAR202 cluster bacterium]
LDHKVWASRIVASLKRFSPSGKYRLNVTPPSATATITIEHGFIKLLIVDGMEIADHRIALANPQFFREGMASDSRRMSEVLTRNMEDMGIEYGQLVGAVPGYQNSLRRIDMPKSGDINPSVFIPREAHRTMGISPDTSFLTWHQLPDSFDRTRWIVIAATRRSITSMLETTTIAEMPPPNLELRAFALARAVNRPDAIIAWAAMDGSDVVIVRDSMPVASQSAYWGADPVDGTVLVNRLTEVVGRTIAVYDEQTLDLPLPESTPLFVTGSPAAMDPSIGGQVGGNLQRPVEAIIPPLAMPSGFPMDDLIVNIGLGLWSE